MTFTLMSLCTFIRNLLYSITEVLSVNIIVIILLQCGFLNFSQKFTTIILIDKELEVAISVMNIWFENEKIQKF